MCKDDKFSRPQGGNLTNSIIQKTHKDFSRRCASQSRQHWQKHRVRCLERRNCGVCARPCPGRAYCPWNRRGTKQGREAVQDEASPTTLPGESPEAKNLLLGEGMFFIGAWNRRVSSGFHAPKSFFIGAYGQELSVPRHATRIQPSV